MEITIDYFLLLSDSPSTVFLLILFDLSIYYAPILAGTILVCLPMKALQKQVGTTENNLA